MVFKNKLLFTGIILIIMSFIIGIFTRDWLAGLIGTFSAIGVIGLKSTSSTTSTVQRHVDTARDQTSQSLGRLDNVVSEGKDLVSEGDSLVARSEELIREAEQKYNGSK